jgi:hypothetical protein
MGPNSQEGDISESELGPKHRLSSAFEPGQSAANAGAIMRILLAISAAFALAACAQSPLTEARDATDHNRCLAMGYRPGTKPYLGCRTMLTQERTARRGAIIGVGF